MLVQPLLEAGQGKLIYTDIFEAFFVEVKVALFAALMISFPVIATQLWRFVAPGLYAKEKKALPAVPADDARSSSRPARPSLISSPCPGRCISCSSFQGNVGGVQQEALPGVGNYLNFVTRFLFGFGVAFLLPILLMILERAGIVTREQLAKSRRYAIVAAAAVVGGADAARRGVDAAAAGAALRRSTNSRSSPSASPTGARRAKRPRSNSDRCRRAQTEEGPEAPPGGGRVGGSGPI